MSDGAQGVNPACNRFAAELSDGLTVAQVRVSRRGTGFELRHVEDQDLPDNQLRTVSTGELRPIAQFNARGVFRPLKSAPDLCRGWRTNPRDAFALGEALDQLYPGFLADWHSLRHPPVPVTHYREYAGRQTGMYRVCATLTDAQAASIALACCDRRFCLKHRLWTAGDALAEAPGDTKSLIPCLEPCAVLMEFARKAARIEQEEVISAGLHPEEVASLKAALEAALEVPSAAVRIADFSSPLNPRRLALLISKLPSVPVPASEE